jgi:Fe2+ or Zn2+ uptake regulation protein
MIDRQMASGPCSLVMPTSPAVKTAGWVGEVIESRSHGHAEARTGHLVADIHDRLMQTGNHIDLSTIYRAVTNLVSLGVQHRAAHAHYHAVCTRCSAVNDTPADRWAPTIETVREIPGFGARNVRITVRGQCADCAWS